MARPPNRPLVPSGWLRVAPVVGGVVAPAVLVAAATSTRADLPVTVSGSTALLALFAAVAGLAAPLLARVPDRLAVPALGTVAGAFAVAVSAGGGTGVLAAYCAAGGLATAVAVSTMARVGQPVPRVVAIAGAAAAVGTILVAIASTAHWRTVFGVAAVLHVVSALPSLRRTASGRRAVGDASEARRRVLRTPTVRSLLSANGALGVLLMPVAFQLTVLLDRDHAGAGTQAFAVALLAAGVVAGATGAGRLAKNSDLAAAVVRQARSAVLSAAVTIVGTSVVPRPLMYAGILLVGAATGVALSLVGSVVAAAVPEEMRPLALGFAALWRWTFGGIGGLVLAAMMRNRFGDAVGLAMLAAPALLGIRALHRAAKVADADVLRVEIDAVEAISPGTRPAGKLLECTGIDFCYGPVQVLFDVSFGVDEGEMVALLGTNGAGKSTLLRVVSGLGLPVRGSVRFNGEDITFLDPDRRLRRGIAQIPGGKAVFGPMSVIDNLRAYGFTHGRDRQAVDRGIEASFEAFPRLRKRSTQHAGTLSGGEQQMLALSKAFMLRPRLLLIDELSLGLAPKVVGELLEMVRRINAQGTAIVLVEQSVNVALSLVDRAYFMEKGAVQFYGAAADLLERGDLLRSVFLEGAAQGLAR
jgi:ABC-type branched-subunit amino acid transport system ATPase component